MAKVLSLLLSCWVHQKLFKFLCNRYASLAGFPCPLPLSSENFVRHQLRDTSTDLLAMILVNSYSGQFRFSLGRQFLHNNSKPTAGTHHLSCLPLSVYPQSLQVFVLAYESFGCTDMMKKLLTLHDGPQLLKSNSPRQNEAGSTRKHEKVPISTGPFLYRTVK